MAPGTFLRAQFLFPFISISSSGEALFSTISEGQRPLVFVPLMPWQSAWQVPACIFGGICMFVSLVALAVHRGCSCRQRFGVFYRGDISAWLSETWQLSVFLLPLAAAVVFAGACFRHPLQTATGEDLPWNLYARWVAGIAALGVGGVGVVAQRNHAGDAIGMPSRYLLQIDVVHGAFMVLGFGGFFVYSMFHACAMCYDVFLTGALPASLGVLVLVQFAISFAMALHFTLWMVETCREECPDDPKCDKRNEWLCAICNGCSLSVLPILTHCVSTPAVMVRGDVFEISVGMRILGMCSTGLLGCAALVLLAATDPHWAGKLQRDD